MFKKKASEILAKTIEYKLYSGAPQCRAATAIYAAGVLCKDWRSQSDIAEIVGITEVSIRNTLSVWFELLEQYDFRKKKLQLGLK